MKILFLHGWHSVPGGVKPTTLREHGFQVINPALDDGDFEAAIGTAQAALHRHQPDLVVGSSRGGAVAMNINTGDTPLVLLCPAWKGWGAATSIKPNSVILHSRHDDVIPFSDSEELVSNSGLPPDALMEVGQDHRLADEAPLSVLVWACRLLGSKQALPWLDESTLAATGSSQVDGGSVSEEGSYVCDACGEEIVVPLDVSEGASQQYVEDCPVCCRANIIHVRMDEQGVARVWAEAEQDRD
jgi:hypothetical protein